MTRREYARKIIAETISALGEGCSEKFVRKVLRAEYPWGERAYHPYRVWCDEVNRQLRGEALFPRRTGRVVVPDKRQAELFEALPSAPASRDRRRP